MYGPLYEFVKDDDISDIDWDGDSLWISSISKGTKKVDIKGVDAHFVNRFSHYVANSVQCEFNQTEQTLSAETETLRITFAHESLVSSGTCFSIRKSMPNLRFTATDASSNGYCNRELMHFLVNCIKMRSNITFCGEPHAGKTECAKFFSTFIRAVDKVITVEDVLEWHYKHINPGKRAVEIKVRDEEDYTKAIKLALRLNPTWLMLSEARSTEVQYLIEGWSTGVHGFTTLHTGDVRDIPDRMINMMNNGIDTERVKNTIYSYSNIGILVKKEETDDGETKRIMAQVGLFNHEENHNECIIIYEDGVFKKDAIPDWFLEKMKKSGIEDPFYSVDLVQRLEDEANGILYGFGYTSGEADEKDMYQEQNIYTSDNVNADEVMNIMNQIQRG